MNFVIDTSALMRLFIPDGALPDGLTAAMAGVERAHDLGLTVYDALFQLHPPAEDHDAYPTSQMVRNGRAWSPSPKLPLVSPS